MRHEADKSASRGLPAPYRLMNILTPNVAEHAVAASPALSATVFGCGRALTGGTQVTPIA